MSSYKTECKTPQALLEKCKKNYTGVFMNVQSKTADHPYWKKKGQWITIKADEEKDHFFQMSEETYNKIKDNLRIRVVSEGK